VFAKHNGNLAENGAVAWMFDQKGVIEVVKSAIDEDDLMLAVMDVGAEDIQDGDEVYEVLTPLADFEGVKQTLRDGGISYGQASLAWIPKTMLAVDSKDAEQIVRLLEALEDLDDVQKVYSNFDVGEETLQQLMARAS
jgi:transcriptional/translational regulatory protein YebC/TACO1